MEKKKKDEFVLEISIRQIFIMLIAIVIVILTSYHGYNWYYDLTHVEIIYRYGIDDGCPFLYLLGEEAVKSDELEIYACGESIIFQNQIGKKWNILETIYLPSQYRYCNIQVFYKGEEV